MALSQRLDLRQAQTLVMTPQLQQAIKLLQLSNVELSEYVAQEIERNPLLERDEGDAPAGPAAPGEPDYEPRDSSAAPPRGTDVTGTDTLARNDRMGADGDAPLDVDYGEVWNDSRPGDADSGLNGASVDWGRPGRGFEDDGEFGVEQTVSGEVTLREHLLGQVNVDLTDAADRLIGAQLVDMIDESGYLTGDPVQIAEQLGAPPERVEAVVKRLQRFDPPGVFARTLSECLALQLADRNRLDPAMQALLDHLDLLARRDIAALIRICGVDQDDLSEMIAEIRALDPKPGLRLGQEVAQPVTPDILMRPQAGGGWIVELNAETLPRVLVNQRYYTRISGAARDKTEREYITDCFASANWLVKSLHQRATTILKVATEIVRQQDAFFAHGVQYLKPLILRDIAEAIGMHESTVSRVTSNKFIATPRGLFELKYFFTASIPGADGGAAHSAEAVRFRIKALIDAEAPEAVLSDDRIVEILREDGIDIARRTVAKYREALRIPSSVQRRRAKAMR
jgi:RNA polymerase sigma-54 factor